jgi:subtilase family serine protease
MAGLPPAGKEPLYAQSDGAARRCRASRHAGTNAAASTPPTFSPTGLSIQAPDAPASAGADSAAPAACSVTEAGASEPAYSHPWIHCNTPQQIAAAYGVDRLHAAGTMGAGQTIVLVDAYGTPTGAQDLQHFHDAFYPDLPDPDFEQICSGRCHDYGNVAKGNGQSGPAAAAGWAGEANLDIEWAYAVAPLAHIVLLAVPPAETEGVQGFPNLFKAMSDAVDRFPAGTVFSQSFGVTEETFGGAAATQTEKFDAVYKKGNAKGDTFLASSGDDGTHGVAKQHRDGTYYDHSTAGWPASSPYVTAVGGTQLQNGWTWNPTSDVPFTADGNFNPAYFGWTDGGFSEPVWNESWLPAAGGGGPSAIYPRPSWQNGVADRIGGNHRAVPDLSWDAAVDGGVLVYTSFFPNANRVGWHVYGGTSAASPQVAGVVALANEQQREAGQAPLGFLNPLIYAVGSNAAAFRDVAPVTEGTAESGKLVDNRVWDYNGDGAAVTRNAVTGWPVLTGWDMTTGFGSPKADGFVAALRATKNAP